MKTRTKNANNKKSSHKNGNLPTSTSKKQADIYHLLVNENLTPKQIAIRRQTTLKAVYNIIYRLRQKGLIQKTGTFRGVTITDSSRFEPIRLHNQQFHINILYKDKRYKDYIKESNIINIDGNTLNLYNDSLDIYSNTSFYGKDPSDATARSFNYWNRIFRKIENQLNIIIIKDRVQNIKLVRSHYAEINNELARNSIDTGDKIQVRTTSDGKVWFLIDNSFNLHEAETVHSKTSKRDMEESIQPFFNDLRDNNPPTLSEVYKLVYMLFLRKAIKELLILNH
jgi:hypothetical protein